MPGRFNRLLESYSREQLRAAIEKRKGEYSVRDNTRVGNISSGMVPAKTVEQKRRDVRLDDGPMGFMPVIGDALQSGQVVKDLGEGKYLDAAMGVSLLLLPNVVEKTVGPVAESAVRKYGNLKFIRNLAGLPAGNLDEGITLAPQKNIFGNFTTDVPFRLHPSYSSMPGGEVLVIEPEAFRGKTPWSIEPMDTFFRSNELTGIDPKYITMISGDEGILHQAESLGMGTQTSQGLIDVYRDVENSLAPLRNQRQTVVDGINLTKQRPGWLGSDIGMLGNYRRVVDNVIDAMGRPTYGDYKSLEAVTGLKSGVSKEVGWNKANLEDALVGLEPGHAANPEYPRSVQSWIQFPNMESMSYYDFRKVAPYLKSDPVPYKNVFYHPYPTTESTLLRRVGGYGHQEYDSFYDDALKWLFDNYVDSNPLAEGGNLSGPEETVERRNYNGVPTTLESYKQQQRNAIIDSAVQKALERDEGIAPVINGKLGESCLYTVTDNFGKKYRVAGNQAFMANPGKYGFAINGPIENADIGTLYQFFDSQDGLGNIVPNHMVLITGYDDSGNPLVSYSRGNAGITTSVLTEHDFLNNYDAQVRAAAGKPLTHKDYEDYVRRVNESDTAIRKADYIRNSSIWDSDGYETYRFVGTSDDNARWEQEYVALPAYDLIPPVHNNLENLRDGYRLSYADGGLLKDYRSGGKIHIKPENRGKFTALKKRTGHSASWFKAHGTPAQKKMAVFALNARKWKHGDGGIIDRMNQHYNGDTKAILELIRKVKNG